MMRQFCLCLGLVVCLSAAVGAADPWADSVVEYAAGDLTPGDFDQPATALGEPSRTTWESINWPSTGALVSVRMTESAWLTTQVCKVGNGGRLTVGFDEPVLNEALNPYGLDLLMFTNACFATTDWPANMHIMDPAMTFGGVLGRIWVSQDNATFYEVANPGTVFPAQAYLSAAADAHASGAAPSDFTRPVNPALSLGSFSGLSLADAVPLYGGAGGGLGIDLSALKDAAGNPVSLDWIQYVKVEGYTSAIDGFSDVAPLPEPGTAVLLGLGGAALVLRRRAPVASKNR